MANANTIHKLAIVLCVTLFLDITAPAKSAQQLRITNAGFTITALPLLAAQGVENLQRQQLGHGSNLMQRHVPPALTQGRHDYQAASATRSVTATMSFSPPAPSVFLRPHLLLADGQTAVQNLEL